MTWPQVLFFVHSPNSTRWVVRVTRVDAEEERDRFNRARTDGVADWDIAVFDRRQP